MKIDLKVEKHVFKKEYMERKYHLVRGAIQDNNFSWESINEILYTADLQSGDTKILLDGKIPESEFIEAYSYVGKPRRKILKPAFYRYMRNGATLVLNRINKTSWSIQDLCNQIAAFSGGQTLANGYFAFAGNGSFGNHWDTHDVFVVQLMGRKRWLLYGPSFELPLSGQTSAAQKAECPQQPVFDGYLNEGDVLYVPRGWWHNALPDSGATFHVAIGVHNPRVTDYVSWLGAKKLSEMLEFRHSIFDEQDIDKVEAAAIKLCSEFSSKENVKLFLSELASSERWVSQFAIEKLGNPEFVFPTNYDAYDINSTHFGSLKGEEVTKLNGYSLARHNRLLSQISESSGSGEVNEFDKDMISELIYGDVISPR